MDSLNPTIFHAYDIRGIYPDDFDAAFAQRLGDRLSAWLKGGIMIVGRDARASSDEIAYALIDGAVHAGARIIDVGVLSTPQFAWAIRSLGAAGGVMVTASHNPERYNGFKVIDGRTAELDVVGGDFMRQIYDSQGQGHRSGGTIEYHSITADYGAAVAYAAGFKGGTELKFSVDAPAGVLSVLKKFGPVAPDHGLAVRFDMDGDRIAFYDDGSLIPADFIFLLLTEQLHLEPVVFDLRFSRTVKERLHTLGIPYTVSRVGRLYITQLMQKTGAEFGGETSGHFYWKEMGGMECPELTLLRVYSIITKSKKTLSELVAPYRVLYKSEEINIPVHDRKQADALMQKVADHFHDGTQNHLDGLTVEYPDWWLNVRQSNTEPVIRFVVEANKKELLDRMVRELGELARV